MQEDRLKPPSDMIMTALKQRRLTLNTSSAILIELYYALEDLGFSGDAIMVKQAEIIAIDNLKFLPFTKETALAAQAIMQAFKVPGLFDAIYAATALNQDPDRTIVSTDEVYEKVAGLKRLDPKALATPF